MASPLLCIPLTLKPIKPKCDVIKQNESEFANIDLNNSIQFSLYFIVLSITKMALSLWNRMLNFDGIIAMQLRYASKMRTEFLFFRVQTRFA